MASVERNFAAALSICPRTRSRSALVCARRGVTASSNKASHMTGLGNDLIPRNRIVITLFFLHPDFVSENATGVIADRLHPGDVHFAGDGLDDFQQLRAHRVVLLSGDGLAFDLVNETALAVGINGYSGGDRGVLDRSVLEVDPVRGEENENQDERDHYVVLDGAALVRPEDVAANCAPNGVHRHRGCAWGA